MTMNVIHDLAQKLRHSYEELEIAIDQSMPTNCGVRCTGYYTVIEPSFY